MADGGGAREPAGDGGTFPGGETRGVLSLAAVCVHR